MVQKDPFPNSNHKVKQIPKAISSPQENFLILNFSCKCMSSNKHYFQSSTQFCQSVNHTMTQIVFFKESNFQHNCILSAMNSQLATQKYQTSLLMK